MKRIQDLRNIGIMAHVDAGKTTLTERVIHYAGLTHRIGDVDDGNTIMDTNEQEAKRGITISSAAITVHWDPRSQTGDARSGTQINIIDTPGHVDFTAEVERALRVLDGAVALFCAVAGVQPQSETVWRQANKYQVPRICFINKMDREGADFQRVTEQIRKRLGQELLVLQLPMGAGSEFQGIIDLVNMQALYWSQKDQGKSWQAEAIPVAFQEQAEAARMELLENLAIYHDELLEQFLEDPKGISLELMAAAIRKASLTGKASAVLCGTAKRNVGIQPLMDAMVSYLPSPAEAPTILATDPQDGSQSLLELDSHPHFAGLVFKMLLDPHVGKIALVRVYTGTLSSGDTITNVRTGRKVKVGRLLRVHSSKLEAVDQVQTGDICALVGLKDLKTGDSLTDPIHPVVLESMDFPEPVIGYAIEAKRSTDDRKMAQVLALVQDEDPTIQVSYDAITGQTVLKGMGELHLEVTLEKMRQDRNLELNTGAPRIAYKEVFLNSTTFHKVHRKQTGGNGEFADIHFEMGPRTDDQSGLEFIDEIKGGVLTREYIVAVEKGFRKAIENGPLQGYPVDSLRIRLFDGSFHKEDSSPMDFENAAQRAFIEASAECEVRLLEPVMKVVVEGPEECSGAVIGDLNRRRGLVSQVEFLGLNRVITAEVPLVKMFSYVTHLRTLSSGRAGFSMEFARYALSPGVPA